MKKINLKHLDLNVYQEKLNNGLQIYICPMDKNDTHVSLVTKYGNDNLEFIPRGKTDFIKVPAGTAHFLEHKMFEMENGEDPMTLYARNGASSNAYTTSNVTRYYFQGTTHLYQNLKILLDCLTNPYFTKQNIQKEQGIINQEIKSGLDNPWQRLYYLANKNLFNIHPHQYDVAGTKESIGKLNQDILYDCYNTFYNPANMFLVITGKVEPNKALQFIKDYYQKKNYENKDKIKQKTYNESVKVKRKSSTEKMDITNKLLTIAYKIKLDNTENLFLTNLYVLIYLDLKFSEITDFYNRNHQDKNLLTEVNYMIENVDDFLIIYFDAEVINSTKILNQINKIINDKTLNEKEFNLIIKNLLNSAILTTENVGGVADILVSQELLYGKLYDDMYNIYKNLDYNDFKKFIDKIDFSNYTIGTIEK